MKIIQTEKFSGKRKSKYDKPSNPYAICITSVGSTAGTQERSKWNKNDKEKYDRCIEHIRDQNKKAEVKKEDQQVQPQITVTASKKESDGWPKKLKKGRFTEWCKRNGFSGPSKACADKAMKSDNASVRGMASFYSNTTLKKKKK